MMLQILLAGTQKMTVYHHAQIMVLLATFGFGYTLEYAPFNLQS